MREKVNGLTYDNGFVEMEVTKCDFCEKNSQEVEVRECKKCQKDFCSECGDIRNRLCKECLPAKAQHCDPFITDVDYKPGPEIYQGPEGEEITANYPDVHVVDDGPNKISIEHETDVPEDFESTDYDLGSADVEIEIDSDSDDSDSDDSDDSDSGSDYDMGVDYDMDIDYDFGD